MEVARIYGWERHGLGFRGPNILPFLIQMALGGFSGIWVVVVDVLNCEEGPSKVVSGTYGLYPCGFYWVPAEGVHPLDALCNGWYLVDIIGHPLWCTHCVPFFFGGRSHLWLGEAWAWVLWTEHSSFLDSDGPGGFQWSLGSGCGRVQL